MKFPKEPLYKGSDERNQTNGCFYLLSEYDRYSESFF